MDRRRHARRWPGAGFGARRDLHGRPARVHDTKRPETPSNSGSQGAGSRIAGHTTGNAESLAAKNNAADRALKPAAIKEVFNELEVVRVQDDAELRRAILAALEKDRHYTVYDYVDVSVDEQFRRSTYRSAWQSSHQQCWLE